MNDYALLINGTLSRIQSFDARPPDAAHKGMRWYPVNRDATPAVTATQRVVPQGALVGDEWRITFTITDITAEVDAQKEARANVDAATALADVTRRGLNVLLSAINAQRAAQAQAPLNLTQFINLMEGATGSSPITLQQFVTYLKGKY